MQQKQKAKGRYKQQQQQRRQRRRQSRSNSCTTNREIGRRRMAGASKKKKAINCEVWAGGGNPEATPCRQHIERCRVASGIGCRRSTKNITPAWISGRASWHATGVAKGKRQGYERGHRDCPSSPVISDFPNFWCFWLNLQLSLQRDLQIF